MSRRRSHKNLRSLIVFSAVQLLTLLIWEVLVGLEMKMGVSGFSSKVLTTGTCLAFYAAIVYWFQLKRMYIRRRRRHLEYMAEMAAVKAPTTDNI